MNRKFLLPFILIFVLLLIVVALPGAVSYAEPPGTGWVKYSLNPVVPVGAADEWDDGLVGSACVIEDGGSYEMWYSGYDGTDYLKIGYATSSDGITWTKYAGNPVLDVGTGWEASGVGAPCVIKESDTSYKMWYTGIDAAGVLSIGYVESANGTTWTTNRQMLFGPLGTWDATGVGAPCVIKESDTSYKMWYTGRTDYDLGTQAIGYATSSDGINWTPYEFNPVLQGGTYAWEARGAGFASVIKAGAKYDIWYTGYAGFGDTGVNSDIGYASSDNGISWTKVPDPALPRTEGWETRGAAAPWISPDGKFIAYTGIDASLVTEIGYALRLEAETQLTEYTTDSSTPVELPVTVVQVKDPFTGTTLSKTVKSYAAVATYDPAGIEMLDVNPGDAPFDTPTEDINNTTGVTTFSQETVAGAAPSVVVARLLPRLIGSDSDTYQLSVTFESLVDTDDEVIKEQETSTLTFQRGDIKKSDPGTVNITDAMFGAQWTVGLRPAEDIVLLNMASVKHDDAPGDKPNITDCMFIAQKAVGLRDANYNLVP